ncbi:MAG TPA: metal-dependent hydrolase, partial [Rugosimonospora sp.]|nr:metal-dependent hydrolase [Rugosimonospora sp.]
MAPARKPLVEVRRSQRRRRTVSAYRDGGRVVVLIPDQFSRAEEREWVDRMLQRLDARDQRTRRTDGELAVRAQRLISRYLPELERRPPLASLRWVDNQHGRWGSCTPADRTIRISTRIMDMPDWVID